MATKTYRYKFCPKCGKKLTPSDQGNTLAVCPKGDFVQYDNAKPGVAILVVSQEKLLLGLRKNEPKEGYWDILGGFVDAGETVEDAVRRELKEETGLSVTRMSYLGSLPDAYGNDQIPTINLCFLVDVQGELKAASDIENLRWFAHDKIPTKLAFSHQKQAIKLWKKSRRSLPAPGPK